MLDKNCWYFVWYRRANQRLRRLYWAWVPLPRVREYRRVYQWNINELMRRENLSAIELETLEKMNWKLGLGSVYKFSLTQEQAQIVARRL